MNQLIEAVALLTKHHIPLEQWGKGEAKTLAHLLQEIEDGETVLVEEHGKLIRKTSVLYLQVWNSEKLLREDRQVFSDGRVRYREHPRGASLAEKLKAGEKPDAAAVERAMKEELKISKFEISPKAPDVIVREMESPSYPGLWARFTEYHYRVKISYYQYEQRDVIMEVQKDKTTYFDWDPMDPAKRAAVRKERDDYRCRSAEYASRKASEDYADSLHRRSWVG